MSALGSLVVKLALEHAEFTKGLDKSSQEALRFAKNTQSTFDKATASTKQFFGGVLAGATGAFAAFATLSTAAAFLNKSLDFADKINDISKANEVLTSTVLRASQALSLNGGEADNVSKLFSALTQSIDEAAQGSEKTQKRFASLGITLDDLAKLDSQQLFNKTLQGLGAIEDPIKRNAAAMDLLGKSVKGVDILGLVSYYASSDGQFADSEKAFQDIGKAMDRLDEFTTKASVSLATRFAPALNAIVETLDNSFFGFDKLEKKMQALGNIGATAFKAQPRIGDAPALGVFKLPKELQAGGDLREVIDPAEVARQKAAEANAKKSADARAQSIKQYQDLIKSIKDKISADKEEISLIQQGVPAQDAATIAKYRALGVSDQIVVSLLNAENAHKTLLETQQAEKAFYEEYEASLIKQLEAVDAQTESIAQQAIELELQNQTFGKLPSAITDVTIARLNDTKATLEGLGLAVDDIKAQTEAYGRLRAAQTNNEFLESEKKRIDEVNEKQKQAIKETEDEAKRSAESINQSLTDALLRGFESGKGFAKNFKETLINLFKTLVLKPVVELIVNSSGISKALSGFTSLASGGGGVAATGGGGISGVLGSIKDVFSSGNNSLVNTVSSLGQSISAFGSSGTGFIKDIASSIGRFTQLNAGFISKALPYAGAVLQLAQGNIAGAALTAVGTFFGGPIGGAIGGALGSLFGGKKKIPRYSTARTAEYDNGIFKAAAGNQEYKTLGAGTQLDGLAETFAKTIGTFLTGFGLNDKVTTTDSLVQKRKASYGKFSATIDGATVSAATQGKAKDTEDTFKRLVETVLSTTLVDAIRSSKVADGIKGLFEGLADKTVIASLIMATTSLNAQEIQLNKQFGLTVDVAGKVIKASGAAGQGLADFANKLTMIAQSSQSVGDVLVNSRANLSKSLSEVYGEIVQDAVTSTVSRQVAINSPVSSKANLQGLGLFGGSQNTGFGMASFGTKITQQFKTVTEQVTTFVDRLVTKTVALPKSLAEFDALIKSVNTSTIGGQKQVADLLQLRDAFGAYTQALDGLKANVKGATFDLRDPEAQAKLMQDELDSLFKGLNLVAPKTKQEFLALADSIDYSTKEGLDLAAALPNLASAFNATGNAVDSLIDSLTRGADSFTNQIDASRYFGISQNYGNQFANDYTNNVENGQIRNGQAAGSGNTNLALIEEIKALRKAVEVQAMDTSKLLRLQIKADELRTVAA